MKIYFIFFLAVMTYFSSCDSRSIEGTTEVHFDIRQCLGDDFGEDLGFSPKKSKIKKVVGDWLTEKGIEWSRMKVDMNFHESVCEACNVCPTGERILITVNNLTLDTIEQLDLLNFDIE